MISIDISPFPNGCHAAVEGILTPESFPTLQDWIEVLKQFGHDLSLDATALSCTSTSLCREFLELLDGFELSLAPPVAPVA